MTPFAVLLVTSSLAQEPVSAPEPALEIEDVGGPIVFAPGAPVCPDAAWPDDDGWVDATAGAHPGIVDSLDRYLFDRPPGDDRTGVRTDGVVVIHRGHVLYERYAAPYGPDVPHLAWSVTKSVANTLTGIAVLEDKLTVNDPVCLHLRDVPDANCGITVANLLEMASGLQWLETYEDYAPTASSVLSMLYGDGRGNMAAFVAHHPLERPPGTAWRYSSGDTNLLMAVVGAAMVPEHGPRYPFDVLFDPIGFTSATFERDGSDTYVGSSYLWGTPRDLARLGFLWLQDGCWDGARLLPDDWMAQSVVLAEPIRQQALSLDGGVQGRLFWLNQALPEQGQPERPWPDLPDDVYAALGHWGQSIFVMPDADLVVVRTADDRDGTFDANLTLKLARDLAEARSGGDPW